METYRRIELTIQFVTQGQGSGSDMGGYVLYKIHEYIREHNFKSKCVLFIHDSLEIDVHPDEILELGSLIIPLMNKFPMEEWGMITTADLAMGMSLGEEVEVKQWDTNEDYTVGDIIIEGYDDYLQPLLENFKRIFRVCEVEDLHEPKPSYVPRSNLFIPKLCVSPLFGTTRYERKVKIHVEK